MNISVGGISDASQSTTDSTVPADQHNTRQAVEVVQPDIFSENLYGHSRVSIVRQRVLSAPFTSKFAGGEQVLELFYSEPFGYILVIDGVVQLMTLDRAYPELLAHVAMFAHQHMPTTPRNALVVGGGDGEIARELMKHFVDFGGPLKSITIVDIDPQVTQLVKNHVPSIGDACVGGKTVSVFEHPRVHFVHQDAREYARRQRRESFDIIICDTTDEKNVATPLFGAEFLEDLYAIMRKGAILVRIAGSLLLQGEEVKKLLEQSRRVFKHPASVALLTIPSLRYYGGNFGAIVSSKGDRVHLGPTSRCSYAKMWLKHLSHYALERHKEYLTPEPWAQREFFGK